MSAGAEESDVAKLVEVILNKSRALNIVRCHGEVCVPICSPAASNVFMIWRGGNVASIPALVCSGDAVLFELLYSRGGTYKRVVHVLSHAHDLRFPQVDGVVHIRTM